MQPQNLNTKRRPVTTAVRATSTAHAITDGDVVLASIDVPATPERVVRALMTDECERWWGAPGVYAIEAWKATLRPGGTWSLVVRLPDGTPLPSSGDFLEVTSGKIVQTRRYDFDHPTLGRRVTRVTTQLRRVGRGTRIVVRHEDFGASEPAFEHAGGWERMLDWLGAYLEAEALRGSAEQETITTNVVLGNHTAVFAARSDQDRIRRFYVDVLGCKVRAETEAVDRFQLGDVHFCFVYQSAALAADDFLKAIYLELKSDDPEETKRKVLAFGVRKLDVPDPHLYFQAPGGQVFRVVGIDEDLSVYEASLSASPAPSTSAP
jgi:uncharacterized protein YndB with AHSA1/START domain/catechol 2,3-dioxygenase-like lactoylglutathione lyase family enzyme